LSHPKIPISECGPFFKRDSYFSKGFQLFEFKKIYFIYFVFIIEFKESKWCSNFLLNDSLSCENLQNKRYFLQKFIQKNFFLSTFIQKDLQKFIKSLHNWTQNPVAIHFLFSVTIKVFMYQEWSLR
jgi:hypothetical protein